MNSKINILVVVIALAGVATISGKEVADIKVADIKAKKQSPNTNKLLECVKSGVDMGICEQIALQ